MGRANIMSDMSDKRILEKGERCLLAVMYGAFALVFIAFLLPAAYFTAQTGTMSLLWIGVFVSMVLATMLTILVVCGLCGCCQGAES